MRLPLALGLCLALAGCGTAHHARPVVVPAEDHPNIVFVLTDDLSGDLLRFMPHVRALERRGATFTNYVVSDSLCCPSRSSIFTGRYPHNTHVQTNYPPHGGWAGFMAHGDARNTFADALERQGYRTALLGKYLNGYPAWIGGRPPRGWTDWAVTDDGYRGYDYALDEDGRVRRYGHASADYLTDVLGRRAQQLIAGTRRPLFLELATFAPHLPATPAPQDLGALPGVRAPRGPAFDVENLHAPAWLRRPLPLTPVQLANIEAGYGDRARSVIDVDRWVGRIVAQLRARHQLRHTYFFFSSDNGFHMGEHRLIPGKRTAFDTDIHVPLIVTGPGIRPGTRVGAVAQNVDLGPTFAAIAGTRMPLADGGSLLPFLHGRRPRHWRTAALVEHLNAPPFPGDPDFQPFTAGDPPTYDALRMGHITYVEERTGNREFYDRRIDPAEIVDRYGTLPPARRRALAARIERLRHCVGWAQCRRG